MGIVDHQRERLSKIDDLHPSPQSAGAFDAAHGAVEGLAKRVADGQRAERILDIEPPQKGQLHLCLLAVGVERERHSRGRYRQLVGAHVGVRRQPIADAAVGGRVAQLFPGALV